MVKHYLLPRFAGFKLKRSRGKWRGFSRRAPSAISHSKNRLNQKTPVLSIFRIEPARRRKEKKEKKTKAIPLALMSPAISREHISRQTDPTEK